MVTEPLGIYPALVVGMRNHFSIFSIVTPLHPHSPHPITYNLHAQYCMLLRECRIEVASYGGKLKKNTFRQEREVNDVREKDTDIKTSGLQCRYKKKF